LQQVEPRRAPSKLLPAIADPQRRPARESDRRGARFQLAPSLLYSTMKVHRIERGEGCEFNVAES
jgi:hypothetical protein